MGSETLLRWRKARERVEGKESNTVGDFKILQYARRRKNYGRNRVLRGDEE